MVSSARVAAKASVPCGRTAAVAPGVSGLAGGGVVDGVRGGVVVGGVVGGGVRGGVVDGGVVGGGVGGLGLSGGAVCALTSIPSANAAAPIIPALNFRVVLIVRSPILYLLPFAG